MTRDIAIGAGLALLVLCATIGPPRLYATGCEDRPLGFIMAQHESDFPQCQHIASIASLIGE